MIQVVADSGVTILVSDSIILVSDPENPVADSDILVSDSQSLIRLSWSPILVSDSDAAPDMLVPLRQPPDPKRVEHV